MLHAAENQESGREIPPLSIPITPQRAVMKNAAAARGEQGRSLALTTLSLPS